MAPRRFAALEPHEKRQVIDSILAKLLPEIEAAVNANFKRLNPEIREIVKAEVGKWAVTEKQVHEFLDGMIVAAAEKTSMYFRPRWLAKLLFFRRMR